MGRYVFMWVLFSVSFLTILHISCGNESAPIIPHSEQATATQTPIFCANIQGTPCTSTLTFTPTNSTTKTPTPTITPTQTVTFTVTQTFSTTPTNTPTPCGPLGIYLADTVIGRVNYRGTIIYPAYVYLAVNNAPETTCAVTVNGPGFNLPLPFQYIDSPTGCARALYRADMPNYQPGQVYSMSISTSIGAVTCGGVAPGDISLSPDGLNASWNFEGNQDQIFIFDPSGVVYNTGLGDVVSPQSIPGSVYSLTGSTYDVYVICRQFVTAIPGTSSGSSMYIVDNLETLLFK